MHDFIELRVHCATAVIIFINIYKQAINHYPCDHKVAQQSCDRKRYTKNDSVFRRAMELEAQAFTVHKKVPLTISRATQRENTNLWIRIRQDGIEGWGEATAFSIVKDEPKDSQRLTIAERRSSPEHWT